LSSFASPFKNKQVHQHYCLSGVLSGRWTFPVAEDGGAGLERARVAAITERAMRGEIEFAPALRERVAVLTGLPDGAAWRFASG
jgi:hypothetical protein